MVKEVYPFPNITDVLSGQQGSVVFSTLDLRQRYYQIDFHPDSQKYTSFILPIGQYEFKKMPFGLAKAPRTFQRIIDKQLRRHKNTRIYLDDILVFRNQEMIMVKLSRK